MLKDVINNNGPKIRLLIVANDAPFAIQKGAAVGQVEDDDVEEDLLAAAELAEQRQMSGQDDVPLGSEGKSDILYRLQP